MQHQQLSLTGYEAAAQPSTPISRATGLLRGISPALR